METERLKHLNSSTSFLFLLFLTMSKSSGNDGFTFVTHKKMAKTPKASKPKVFGLAMAWKDFPPDLMAFLFNQDSESKFRYTSTGGTPSAGTNSEEIDVAKLAEVLRQRRFGLVFLS